MSFTEAHYVTQNGAGLHTGRNVANAWSVTEFQNSANWSTYNSVDGKIGPGDVVYFSGNFTSRPTVMLGGNANGSVTLDGFEAGETDPVHTINTGTALLTQGMEVGNGTAGPDYLTIQDFRMTRTNSTLPGFRLYGAYGNSLERVIVRRNYVYQTYGTLFYYYRGRYCIIEDNKFINFGQGGTNATQGVNFIETHNTLVRRNIFGHSRALYPDGCTSANMVELHGCNSMLLEYNDIYGAPNQSGVATKEHATPNRYIVYRFNKVHKNNSDHEGRGLGFNNRVETPHQDFYVYGNYLVDNFVCGLMVGKATSNLYVWANIISNNHRAGIVVWENSTNLNFINNTIARNNIANDSDITRGGISIAKGSTINIKNNIFWNNSPGSPSGRRHQVVSYVPLTSLEHNRYYHDGGAPTFYYNSAYRDLAYLKSIGFENATPAGSIINPLFVSPSGLDGIHGTVDDNYRLSSSSTLINAGKTLTGSFSVNLSGGDSWFETNSGYGTLNFGYDDAIDPVLTDWTT